MSFDAYGTVHRLHRNILTGIALCNGNCFTFSGDPLILIIKKVSNRGYARRCQLKIPRCS